MNWQGRLSCQALAALSTAGGAGRRHLGKAGRRRRFEQSVAAVLGSTSRASPQRLAERLASMSDPREIAELLNTEYRRALAVLASSLRADAEAELRPAEAPLPDPGPCP